MKIAIEVECPSWMKRVSKVAFVTMGIATAGMALGGPLVTFTAGQTLTAADLNANFTNLQGQVTALQGQQFPASMAGRSGTSASAEWRTQ